MEDIILASFCRIVAVHSDMAAIWADGCVERNQSSALSRLPESIDTVLHLLVDRVSHRFHKLRNQMHAPTHIGNDDINVPSRSLYINNDHLLLVAEFDNPSLDQIGKWVARGDIESLFAMLLTRCCALRPRTLLSSSSSPPSSSSSSTANGPPAAKRRKASETDAIDIPAASTDSPAPARGGSLTCGFDCHLQTRIALARVARLRGVLRQPGHLADTTETASNRSTPRAGGNDSHDQDNNHNLLLSTQECADCLLVLTNLLKECADDDELPRAQESHSFLRNVLLVCVAEVAGAFTSIHALHSV